MKKEYMKDTKIRKINVSRYIVLDKNEGLKIFLNKNEVPTEIPVRTIYKEGEIIIKKK